MAEINAMLDLASPAMREALLIAFLDRLARPPRGALPAASLAWVRSRDWSTRGWWRPTGQRHWRRWTTRSRRWGPFLRAELAAGRPYLPRR